MATKLSPVERRRVDSFVKRYKKNAGKEIDNSSLVAGSPMYIYCRGCRAHVATLPESYTTRPPRYCEDCEELKRDALLDVALEKVSS